MKITISGWPGAGSSTLSILLCYKLNYKLLQGGEVFRYLYKQLSYQTTGEARLEGHNYAEPYFGPLYDKFVDELLLENDYDNTLVESDITSFRIGKNPNVLSIFLKANIESRKKRTTVDQRGDEGDFMEKIDKEHQEMYIKLHNVDFLDEAQIEEKHYLVLDNSDLSIADEMKKVYDALCSRNAIDEKTKNDLKKTAEQDEKEYWEKGKEWYKNELKQKGLFFEATETMEAINKRFTEEIKKMPEDIQKAMLKNT